VRPCFVMRAAILILTWWSLVAGRLVRLTEKNWDSHVSSGSWIVNFFVSWCTQCKTLLPEFEAAAKASSGPVSWGSVDCTEQAELSKRLNIVAYPTIKVIRNGQDRDYHGARNAKELTNLAARMIRRPVTEVDSPEALSKLRNGDPVGYLLFIDKGQFIPEWYMGVAEELRDRYYFGATWSQDLMSSFGIQPRPRPQITVIGDDIEPEPFVGPFTDDSWRQWVFDHRYPLISKILPHNCREVLVNGKNPVVYILDSSQSNTTDDELQRLRWVARRYRRHFLFAYADLALWSAALTCFNVQEAPLPRVLVMNRETERLAFEDPEQLNPDNMHEALARMPLRIHSQTSEHLPMHLGLDRSDTMHFPTRVLDWVAHFKRKIVLFVSVWVIILLVLCGCCWAILNVEEEEVVDVGDGKNRAVKAAPKASPARVEQPQQVAKVDASRQTTDMAVKARRPKHKPSAASLATADTIRNAANSCGKLLLVPELKRAF